jgi:hypothetical protein
MKNLDQQCERVVIKDLLGCPKKGGPHYIQNNLSFLLRLKIVADIKWHELIVHSKHLKHIK